MSPNSRTPKGAAPPAKEEAGTTMAAQAAASPPPVLPTSSRRHIAHDLLLAALPHPIVVVAGAIRTRLERQGAEGLAPIRLIEDLEGTARISARTGRPLSFELKTVKRTRQNRDEVVEHGRLRGTIQREGPAEDR